MQLLSAFGHKMTLLNPYRFGGGGGSFVPTDITGLKLWLDADDIDTLYQDTGKTTPVTSDSDPVGCWADKSGEGNDHTEATNQPTYKTSQINSLPALLFASDVLNGTNPSASSTEARTIYIVSLPSSTGSSNTIFCPSAANAGNGTRFQITPEIGVRCITYIRIFDSAASTTNASIITVSCPSTPNTSDIDAWLDGVSLGENALTDGAVVSSDSSSAVGARNSSATAPFAGLIAEILYYTGEHTAGERAQVEQYLATKWGITI